MSTKTNTINIDHRLNGYEPGNTDSYSLVDAVDPMVRRGQAVIRLIQFELVNDRADPSPVDLICFDALESISMELGDINKLVEHFHNAQEQETQKEL